MSWTEKGSDELRREKRSWEELRKAEKRREDMKWDELKKVEKRKRGEKTWGEMSKDWDVKRLFLHSATALEIAHIL